MKRIGTTIREVAQPFGILVEFYGLYRIDIRTSLNLQFFYLSENEEKLT
jgi:hypothetical protein